MRRPSVVPLVPAVLIIFLASRLSSQGAAGLPGPAARPAATAAHRALADGEEPIVTTHHTVALAGRALRYTARAGRLPIRDNTTGEVHGQMFFVAYAVDRPAGDPPRPLTFVWNGGPGSNAALVHLIGFGPKRIAPPPGASAADDVRWVVEANPATWLVSTDLVFVDPIGTGYSRPTRADYGAEFYQTPGDAESVAEFIRVYRTRYDAWDAPIVLAGESYGVTRAAWVARALERRGTAVRGVILMGLELPLGNMPAAVRTALGVPTFTVAAFTHGKLPGHPTTTMDDAVRAATRWAELTYAPALARRAELPDPERRAILDSLAMFTGLAAASIDRDSLAVDRMGFGNALLAAEGQFVGQYDSRMVGPRDTTGGPYDPTRDPSLLHLLDDVAVLRYLRDELGYRSDMRYQGPFGGGYPPPTAPRGDWMSVRWRRWPGSDSTTSGQPLADAMRMNPALRVLSACGIYDLVCTTEGNRWIADHLDETLRQRVQARAYAGGHAMYTDRAAALALARDVTAFIRLVASQPSVRSPE